MTDKKNNEITAIPELLEVTIDVMGAQTAITEKIVSREAENILELKENQPTLLEDARLYFEGEYLKASKSAVSNRIKREVMINGTKRWVTGNTEQEYVENLMKLAWNQAQTQPHPPAEAAKYNFRAYAKNWFITYSNPNIERAIAQTYKRHVCSYQKGHRF